MAHSEKCHRTPKSQLKDFEMTSIYRTIYHSVGILLISGTLLLGGGYGANTEAYGAVAHAARAKATSATHCPAARRHARRAKSRKRCRAASKPAEIKTPAAGARPAAGSPAPAPPTPTSPPAAPGPGAGEAGSGGTTTLSAPPAAGLPEAKAPEVGEASSGAGEASPVAEPPVGEPPVAEPPGGEPPVASEAPAGAEPAAPETGKSEVIEEAPEPAPATGAGSPSTVSGESSTTPEFASDSVWNNPLPAQSTLASNSASLVKALASQAESEETSGIGPWIDTKQSSMPIYVAGPDQATVDVLLKEPHAWWREGLQAAFDAVPIPSDAKPGGGSDKMMSVYQPSTGRLWEFFNTTHEDGVWRVAWGGAIEHVSQSPGYYTASSWAKSADDWGATATSLSLLGGLVTFADLQRGAIEHALLMSLPYPRAGVFASPAERCDGTGTVTTDIPEGTRLRLPSSLDVASLHLPHLTEMMALAAQKYGILVGNQTHYGIAFYAQEPTSGTNPYTGSGGYFDKRTPTELLASFPWSSLQVVKATLHSTTCG